RYARFWDLPRPVLLVVVDTEEGFDWSAPFSAEQHSVSAMRRISLCQSVFESFGITPTYVVDYPIANDDHASDELCSFANQGLCIIGSHLQPWVNPPIVETLDL